MMMISFFGVVLLKITFICVYEGIDKIAKSWMCQPSLLVIHCLSRWIVVAPNRKNIKGKFLEHVGYWAPRQGVNVDRQITLNMPRIKYWLGNGAVPTPRIQTFLSYWGIMPKPFYVESKSDDMKVQNHQFHSSR